MEALQEKKHTHDLKYTFHILQNRDTWGVICCAPLTLCDTATKATLKAPTPLDKLHVGAHVGLAAVAADGTSLTVVHQIRRGLEK